jgi:undecaprenyl diphosphate synthase
MVTNNKYPHTSSTQKVPAVAEVPKHVAIIMDGNGRWATKRLLPRVAGHSQGLSTVREIVKECGDAGVEYLTLFAFSSENWRRPAEEVGFLMKLFLTALEKEITRLHRNNVRLRVIGDLSRFDPVIQERVTAAEKKTDQNTGLNLTIAANYGGRWDILEAVKACISQHPNLSAELVSEELLQPYFSMSYAPEPDLFIRTGGEQRISNFLLWQLAYTELYFTNILWPDFDKKELQTSFAWYRERERRFGRTSAQVMNQTNT